MPLAGANIDIVSEVNVYSDTSNSLNVLESLG